MKDIKNKILSKSTCLLKFIPQRSSKMKIGLLNTRQGTEYSISFFLLRQDLNISESSLLGQVAIASELFLTINPTSVSIVIAVKGMRNKMFISRYHRRRLWVILAIIKKIRKMKIVWKLKIAMLFLHITKKIPTRIETQSIKETDFFSIVGHKCIH